MVRRAEPWPSPPHFFKTCLDKIRIGIRTGYAPNIHDDIAYQQLNKKERTLIDNIFKTSFDVDGVYD